VTESTLSALQRFRSSGRKLILVTGREIPELKTVCPEIEIFDLVVGENGGVLYNPKAPSKIEPLAKAPPPEFADELKKAGVAPLSCGSVVVASLSNHEQTIRSCIERLRLDLRVILNKGSLMVLPTGVDKASGLRHALSVLDIPASKTWAIGDAENDIEFLLSAGFPAAVANALPSVRSKASFISHREAGSGVEELIDKILSEDLSAA
jgi:hypothetical protein